MSISIWLPIILVVEAFAFFYLRVRRWKRLTLSRNSIHFPKLCPNCISSNPIIDVFEASWSKTISFRKSEFLHLHIPYCEQCGNAINHNRQKARKIGLLAAVITFATLWYLSIVKENEPQSMLAIFIGLCFAIAWPLNELWGNHKRALILRRYNDRFIDLKIKNDLYCEALRQANL